MVKKLSPSLLALFLAGCGSASNDSPKTSTVNVGISDAPIENLSSVVVCIGCQELRD